MPGTNAFIQNEKIHHKKNIIVVTGGAGFVGSNLIEYLIEQTSFQIISIDNYSSGSKKNHIKSNRLKYLYSDTSKITKALKKYKKIVAIFHFSLYNLKNLSKFFKI